MSLDADDINVWNGALEWGLADGVLWGEVVLNGRFLPESSFGRGEAIGHWNQQM